jgi:hypothetical protein
MRRLGCQYRREDFETHALLFIVRTRLAVVLHLALFLSRDWTSLIWFCLKTVGSIMDWVKRPEQSATEFE